MNKNDSAGDFRGLTSIGRKHGTTRAIFESLPALDQRRNLGVAIQFSAAVHSKIPNEGNELTPRCTNLRADTGDTVAFEPSHLSPWNERGTTCI